MFKSSLVLFSAAAVLTQQTDARACNEVEVAQINTFYKEHQDVLHSNICAADLEILSLPNCVVNVNGKNVNFLQSFLKCYPNAGGACTAEENKKIVTFQQGTVWKECVAETEKAPKAGCTDKPACVKVAKEFKSLPTCNSIMKQGHLAAETCVKDAEEKSSAASTSVLSAALVLVSAVAYLM